MKLTIQGSSLGMPSLRCAEIAEQIQRALWEQWISTGTLPEVGALSIEIAPPGQDAATKLAELQSFVFGGSR